MCRFSFVLIACMGLASVGVPPSLADDLFVASWNVENLFDLEDDPAVELDEEYIPTAEKKWTAERLDIKLANLAKVISKLNDGRGPDVLGLCEVENRTVVEMLVAKLTPLGRDYRIVHQDSPSDRGIDCALVYDAKVFKLLASSFYYVEAENTRDIVEATLARAGAGDDAAVLRVFVNHWPSRNNDEWQRIAAAKVLRRRLDEILARDAAADIVIVGDFNDEPGNVSIQDQLKAAPTSDNLPPGAVYDTTASIAAAGKGTFVWDDQWNLIDHIIVSAGLLDEAGYRWKPGSSRRIEYPELFFHPTWEGAIPRPSASYSSNDFHEDGYSDHLPVACVLAD